ncbi:AP-4-A phosphorylase [Aquisphaera giovannonii]|uniref:AP-4-A phosphorylase n=1 Tax=Aquisphaera giovannonii TaxID=406548 RepID=A0A5B9VVT2_9BACT|nr:HIT family protein [Aquisphaera giovannonii]QEH32184.1 AP-4-A phosphorylase [Aquisphaera giovannonii]
MAEPTSDPGCIFCKLLDGEIPSTRVLETDEAVAFLDAFPLNPGHTLLVPRAHHAQLADLPDALAAHCGELLPRLCRAVKAATNAEGANVVVNLGRVAGQSVDHVHYHVIPRFQGDPIRWPWPQGRLAPEDAARLAAAIRAGLSS